MEGEVLVNTAEASDEVVFEHTDGTFGCIAMMDARRGKLEVNVLVAEVLFQQLSAFIVKALETWVQAGSEKGGMQSFAAGKDGGTSVILEGFSKDCIAFIVVDKQ
jgi:hypothetical protein